MDSYLCDDPLDSLSPGNLMSAFLSKSFYCMYLLLKSNAVLLCIHAVQIAYFVAVQIEESCNSDGFGLSPEMRHRSTVGAVRVALRTLAMGAGSSNS